MKVPKLPEALTAEQKLAALAAAEPGNTAALADKETGGKPWLLANKKAKIAYPARLDGDIDAKLEVVLDLLGRKDNSKNSLINQAIEEFSNRILAERGLL